MRFLRRERLVSRQIAQSELGAALGVLAEEILALLVLRLPQRGRFVVLLVVVVFIVLIVVFRVLVVRLHLQRRQQLVDLHFVAIPLGLLRIQLLANAHCIDCVAHHSLQRQPAFGPLAERKLDGRLHQ